MHLESFLVWRNQYKLHKEKKCDMADLIWAVRRLKAMSVPEITWRLSQKLIQNSEKKKFATVKTAVTSSVFNKKIADFHPDVDRMYLNYDNVNYSCNKEIKLLGDFPYEKYKNKWNAGFQSERTWPDTFSYSIKYKQKDDIGDARTNWELNRHFQFALLAKNYFATKEKTFLDELIKLYSDWNEKNPFLHGISWTSVMEVAIRASNWCYVYAFLARSADVPEKLMEQLRIGILNMTDYIAQHYSRFSSANNHLIVEAYAIGQSGILFNYKPWVSLSVSLLTKELPLQNYSDSINKELSLHYQSFYMEAMGLMLRLLKKNGYQIPESWEPMLERMSQYVADCIGPHGEVIEFGDNDEGKILDLHGGEESHYLYVLGLLSVLLTRRYVNLAKCSENIKWLFTKEELKQTNEKLLYTPSGSVTYKEGGNSILRSKDGRALIGIDHAALGFGSIAAHGHADALSFQMYLDGQPLFIDPGTYIYHCDLSSRNAFRKTENHNTVCIGEKDQSEMLGAFLWGKKAQCKLLNCELGDEDLVEAEHNGYSPDRHLRRFLLSDQSLTIKDSIRTEKRWKSTLQLCSDVTGIDDHEIIIKHCDNNIHFKCEGAKIKILPSMYSPTYGILYKSRKIQMEGTGDAVITLTIKW